MKKINRNYTKNLYNRNHQCKPLQATIPKTAKLAEISSDIPDIPDKDSSDLIDLQDDAYHPIPDLTDHHNSPSPPNDTYHMIPSPVAKTGNTLAPPEHDQLNLFEDNSYLLFDPTNYLHFTS
jgi:hypothetical protein